MPDWEDEVGDTLRPEEEEIPERFTQDKSSEVPCPECKNPVSEVADRCPSCGMNVIPNKRSTPAWLLYTAVFLLICLLAPLVLTLLWLRLAL